MDSLKRDEKFQRHPTVAVGRCVPERGQGVDYRDPLRTGHTRQASLLLKMRSSPPTRFAPQASVGRVSSAELDQ